MRRAPSIPRSRRGRAVRYERSLLEALLDRVDLAIVACDRDGRVSHVSAGARTLVGPAFAVGSGPEDWIDSLRPRTPEGLPLAVEDLAPVRVMQGRASPRFDVRVQGPSGELLLRISAHPLLDGGGGPVLGAIVVLQDLAATPPRAFAPA